jgi:hypothetical protein
MTVETWEALLVGALVVLLLLWLGPGVRKTLARRPQASAADWRGLLLPLGMVGLFVLLLVLLA